jgi:hypothetical protein
MRRRARRSAQPLGGVTMKHYLPKLLVLAIAPFEWLSAGESANASPTAGEFVIDMVAESPRVYAAMCTTKNPAMQADFDRALLEFRTRVVAVAKPLLSSDLFNSLNHARAPQEAIDSLRAQNEARMDEIKDADAFRDCPRYLDKIRRVDGEMLKVGITMSLSEIQALIAGKKKGVFK